MINTINYKEYRKKNDIHGTVLYPAVMVAPIQKKILENIIREEEIISVFDPFHGSGTALYEALELDPNMHIVGCDINPLANLITKVKLQGVTKNISKDIDAIEEYLIDHTEIFPYEFPNMKKWFREDIIDSIALLRTAIMKISNTKNRLFFWYILINVLRYNSNTRSSTYKLHIKSEDSIKKMQNNVIKYFLFSVRTNYLKFVHKADNYILYKKDVLNIIGSFDDDLYDVSITSPPYGDNATTVPYGQFSMLALYTIPTYDLELEGWELDNYSKIDSNSVGSKNKPVLFDDYEKSLLKNYLCHIALSKQKKVINYFNDYFYFLRELCRVTKKYIVLTLGNRTVDRININLVSITRKYLQKNNYEVINIVRRIIPRKRTPKITSCVYQHPVKSMNYEYILVYKKTKFFD